MKRIIITENQKSMLKLLIETEEFENAVNTVHEFLKKNYKRAIETYRADNEYKHKKVFEIIVDEELISPHDLLEYLKVKYKYSEPFLKQVINDWAEDNIKDSLLSKTVLLY